MVIFKLSRIHSNIQSKNAIYNSLRKKTTVNAREMKKKKKKKSLEKVCVKIRHTKSVIYKDTKPKLVEDKSTRKNNYLEIIFN